MGRLSPNKTSTIQSSSTNMMLGSSSADSQLESTQSDERSINGINAMIGRVDENSFAVSVPNYEQQLSAPSQQVTTTRLLQPVSSTCHLCKFFFPFSIFYSPPYPLLRPKFLVMSISTKIMIPVIVSSLIMRHPDGSISQHQHSR